MPFLARADVASIFSVTLDPGMVARHDAMVAIPHGVAKVPDEAGGALLVPDGGGEPLHGELDPGDRKLIWVKVPGEWKANKPLNLKCTKWEPGPVASNEGKQKNFLLKDENNHVTLHYHATPDPAPAGKSPNLVRSAFIHPLSSPAGDPLTTIRPSDHLHHMGIWNAWTDTKFQGKKVDFWNIKDGTGTVRFRNYAWRHRGNAWNGFSAHHDHIAWPGKPNETKVLDETLVVRQWRAGDMILTDYEFTQKNISKSPLELKAYRYGGGIAYRARGDWKLGNSSVLTSEGKTRENAFESRARWVAACGPTENGDAGLAILGHPGNPDAPERLRTWKADHGGAVFINFVPTQEKAMTIAPGESLNFRYRLAAYQGKTNPDRLNKAWQDFANPVKLSVTVNPAADRAPKPARGF